MASGNYMSKTSSIQDIIDYGKKLDISHSKLHIKSNFLDDKGDNIIINYTSILDKYYDLVMKSVITYSMTDDEYIKYVYRPKTLSYDLYNTVELWSAILRINNLFSAAQFNKQVVKVFSTDIFEIINEILILEEKAIKENNKAVYGK